MKTQLYLYIAVRIIFLFSIAMLSTFLPDHLREFFGDTKFMPYTTTTEYYSFNHTECGSIDTEWIWGSRHYWFYWMMIFLFLLSLVDAVISIRRMILKHYPNI